MKDINKLLKKEKITRKDLVDEGFTDYEIKKFVDSGILVKDGRALYKVVESDDIVITKLIDSFTRHDSLEVAKFYDMLKDKDTYNYEIIKLLLVSLSRIESILTSSYIVNREVSQEKSSYILETEEKTDDLNDEKNSQEDIVIEELGEKVETFEELDVIETEEIDADIELELDWLKTRDKFDCFDDYLDYLYDEYKKIRYSEMFKAEEVLLKYIDLCEENNITGDYYYELALLRNRINRIEVPYDVKRNQFNLGMKIKGLFKEFNYSSLTLIEQLFDDYRKQGYYDNDFEYHQMLGTYYRLKGKFDYAKEEYLKALDICDCNPIVYYDLAVCTFGTTAPYQKCNESLSYMNKYVFYNKGYLSSGAYSFLALLNLFSGKIKSVYNIFQDVCYCDDKYIHSFYKNFEKNLSKRYSKLINIINDSSVWFEKIYSKEMVLFLEDNFDKHLSFCSSIRKINFQNPLQDDIEHIKSIVESSDVDKLSRLDNEISSIEDDEHRNKFMLESAVILAENNFVSKAKKYLSIVEGESSKSEDVKKSFEDARCRVKIKSCIK